MEKRRFPPPLSDSDKWAVLGSIRPGPLLQIMPGIERAELRLDESLSRWDSHMGSCKECLAFGQHMCDDGEYLTSTARRAGQRLALARAIEAAHSSRRPMRLLDHVTMTRAARSPGAPAQQFGAAAFAGLKDTVGRRMVHAARRWVGHLLVPH